MTEHIAVTLSVGIDPDCKHVVLAFGPMEAGDVVLLLDFVAEHREQIKDELVGAIAAALAGMDMP